MTRTVLVTGGAGYLGSHTVLGLLRRGDDVVVVDSFVTGTRAALRRVALLAGCGAEVHAVDLRDGSALRRVLRGRGVDAVVHMAGLKSVHESIQDPLRYYDANVRATVSLCEAMEECGVRSLVFSSSATVYGNAPAGCFVESMPMAPVNPYGRTKAMAEHILYDLARSGGWRIAVVRCFNPVGADPSGSIGEDAAAAPSNLLPYVVRVAAGQHPWVAVYGGDYHTGDGTAVRDYLHVSDVAAGHLSALDHLPAPGRAEVYNLGTGRGHTVLELLDIFEQSTGVPVPRRVADRRPGDVAVCWADPGKANAALGWRAERSVADACADAWRWHVRNPAGYRAVARAR